MDLEMLKTPNSYWVPMIDGNVLHSLVDPNREAERFVDSIEAQVRSVQSILVLGLGGGFHIQKLRERFPDKNILVIEAHAEIVDAIKKKNQKVFEQCDVLVRPEVDKVHVTSEICELFSGTFSIVRHPASWRSASQYYTDFLFNLNSREIDVLKSFSNARSELESIFSAIELKSGEEVTISQITESIDHSRERAGYPQIIWKVLGELVT